MFLNQIIAVIIYTIKYSIKFAHIKNIYPRPVYRIDLFFNILLFQVPCVLSYGYIFSLLSSGWLLQFVALVQSGNYR